MKKLLQVVGLVVVLLVAIALLAPLFISTEDITQTISSQVEETTGRTLTVDGEKSLSVFPSLTLQLEQVRFSNMASGSRPDMATMASLQVHIPWLSLLSGELSIEKFIINKPDILLETDAAGNTNWDIMPTAGPEPETADSEAPPLPAGLDISLGEVAIYGGRLRLLDHQAGTEQVVNELAITIALPSLNQDLTLAGAITWMGEALDLNVTLSTPAQLLSGKSFELALALESRLVKAAYSGNISAGGEQVTGSLEVSADSVQELAAWQNVALAGGDDAFKGFTLRGDMVFAGDLLSITGLQAGMDALQITGASSLRLTETALIKADVDLGMLDLNPYLPPVADIGDRPPAGAADAPARPLEWDDAAIDLSALKTLNADINLRSSGLRARDIKLGANALQLRLNGGRLDLALQKFAAYGGNGKGGVTVDARRRPYRITTDFDLAGISAQPLLTDVADFDKLLGNGALRWQLQTVGVSQVDFVSALTGNVDFKFSDGAVKGANIAAMVRSAESLIKGDASGLNLAQGFDQAQQTDFSELGGSLVFTSGVGRNNDLSMASPLLRVAGEGMVDLPRALIDYGLTARLVSSIEGQGAGNKSNGVGIPVRIKGPFHDVNVKPDVSKAAKDKVKDTLKDALFKRFGNKD